MLEEKLTITEQQALDIAENPADITPEQLDALLSDADLREKLDEVEGLRQAVRQARCTTDTEERLRAWHRTHDDIPDTATDNSGHSAKHGTLIRSLLRIAAVFAGVVAIAAIYSLYGTADNAGTAAVHEKGQQTVFTADTEGKDVTLAAHGKNIALKQPKSARQTVITKSDLEALLADASATEQLTLTVPYGRTADVTLPDGSTVYMHPGARIVFPNRFAGSHRIVKFEGEAYFCVAHDAAHPFVVKSGAMETTVLGTEFNISTTRREVCLVKGSVRLDVTTDAAAAETKPVTLEPNQAATLNGTLFSVAKADITPYEFWRDGYLYFGNSTLQDIMEEIGRTFNMTVVFRNAELLRCRMRFIAPRTEGVAAAVDAVNSMKKGVVSVKGNTIYVD